MADSINEEEYFINIFINNVDSYQSRALCKMLHPADELEETETSDDKVYKIFATLSLNFDLNDYGEKSALRKHVNKFLSRHNESYFDNLIECKFIIYDIGSCPEELIEVENFLQYLEHYQTLSPHHKEILNDKFLILISSPLCWSTTNSLNDDNIFIETDYRKRRPHPHFVRHKCLEREVIQFPKKINSFMRTLVVCPGFTYGLENDIFHYIFRLAFYNNEIIPIPEPGFQILPLIYIKDFTRMIKQILENFPDPDQRYIFAMEPKAVSLYQFALRIINNVAGNTFNAKIIPKEELLKYDKYVVSQNVIDAITSNIRMVPTYFENYPFTFTNLLDMSQQIVKEFRQKRKLIPFKILVDGPPLSGKTTVSKSLVSQYRVQYIDPTESVKVVVNTLERDIVLGERYLIQLEVEKVYSEILNQSEEQMAVEQEFLQETRENVRENIENWKTLLEDIRKFLISDEKNPETIFEYTRKCLIEVLSSKQYNENQGYVIDGFLFSYDQMKQIFGEPFHEQKDDDGNEDETEVAYRIRPGNVIILQTDDEMLVQRAMQYSALEAIKYNATEDDVLDVLEQYRKRDSEDNCLYTYFFDCNIIPMELCVNQFSKRSDVLNAIQTELGPPNTYHMNKCDKLIFAKTEKEKQRLEQEANLLERQKIAKKVQDDREQKIRNWGKEFERLKREEEIVQEVKAYSIRNYLSKFVLPTLNEGLVKVAQIKPEDPIDFLAEYLFRCNKTGRVLPDNHTDELKKLLLSNGNESVIEILTSLAENETSFKCSKTDDDAYQMSLIEQLMKQRKS